MLPPPAIRRLVLLATLVLGACQTDRLAIRDPDAAPVAGSGSELTVMSFNIRYGTADDGDNSWPHRREQVIDVIRGRRPDVVGLQEALHSQLEEIRAALWPEYGVIGVGRDDGGEAGEYAAILYRAKRFVFVSRSTTWFSETPHVPGSMSWGNRIPRVVTSGRLFDANAELGVYVYNVHLDHRSQPSRAKSIEYLLRMIELRDRPDSPVLVMGDFNAGERSPEILAMGRGAIEFADTFRVLHPDATGVGTFNGFEGRTDGEKIDYIFISPEFEVLEAEIIRDHVDGRYPSDHFPVSARVRIRPSERLEAKVSRLESQGSRVPLSHTQRRRAATVSSP